MSSFRKYELKIELVGGLYKIVTRVLGCIVILFFLGSAVVCTMYFSKMKPIFENKISLLLQMNQQLKHDADVFHFERYKKLYNTEVKSITTYNKFLSPYDYLNKWCKLFLCLSPVGLTWDRFYLDFNSKERKYDVHLKLHEAHDSSYPVFYHWLTKERLMKNVFVSGYQQTASGKGLGTYEIRGIKNA